jgi:hypothetical protein
MNRNPPNVVRARGHAVTLDGKSHYRTSAVASEVSAQSVGNILAGGSEFFSSRRPVDSPRHPSQGRLFRRFDIPAFVVDSGTLVAAVVLCPARRPDSVDWPPAATTAELLPNIAYYNTERTDKLAETPLRSLPTGKAAFEVAELERSEILKQAEGSPRESSTPERSSLVALVITMQRDAYQ